MKRSIALLCLLGIAVIPLPAQTTLSRFIDSLVRAEWRNDQPGGVLMVTKHGKVIYRKAFGMANMELQVPMKEDMALYIGSITKQFTAVGILQLLGQGKLALQDTLGKYIDSCSPAVAAISLEQLLRHTSGLSQQADRVRQALAFPSNTKWQYNNGNYSLLGSILEKVSGRSYSEYMQEYIFKPAGMTHTVVANDTQIVANLATGYKLVHGQVWNDRIFNSHSLKAAGGIISTAEDMAAWCSALYSGKLIKKETLARAFTAGQLNNGKPVEYGFGWHLQTVQGSEAHRHGGSVPGFIAESLYFPEEEVFVLMLLNAQSGLPAMVIGRVIGAKAIGKPYPLTPATIDPKKLPGFVGIYENNFNETIEISIKDSKLYFQRPGGKLFALTAASERSFFFEKYLVVQFNSDASGAIQSLNFSRAGIGEMIWKKRS